MKENKQKLLYFLLYMFVEKNTKGRVQFKTRGELRLQKERHIELANFVLNTLIMKKVDLVMEAYEEKVK